MKFDTIALGDLYDTSSGLSKNAKEFGYNAKYPFLSFRTIFNNYFLPEELTDCVNTTEEERNKYSVRKGDIFLTRTSETFDELGMSSVALKDYPEATFNGFTKRLRRNTKIDIEIYPKYIGYCMRSRGFREQVTSMSIMTTRASLNNNMIARLQIPIPEYPAQVKIGDTLYLFDEEIKTNLKINENLAA